MFTWQLSVQSQQTKNPGSVFMETSSVLIRELMYETEGGYSSFISLIQTIGHVSFPYDKSSMRTIAGLDFCV